MDVVIGATIVLTWGLLEIEVDFESLLVRLVVVVGLVVGFRVAGR